MNEDYIIKSGDNKSVTINGGSNSEKVGIKLLSSGSQLFASNNNFLFYTDNKSDKAFLFQTEENDSGIIFENGKKNRIAMIGNKGVFFDFFKLNVNLSQISKFIYGDTVKNEYRNGCENIISGKGISFDFKEDRLEFQLNMFNGSILFNQFKKFISTGEEFIVNSGKNSINLNKKYIELLIGERGLSLGESMVMTSDNDIKLVAINGNLDIHTKNGEKVIIGNGRPNGIIELNSSRYIGKIGQSIIECRDSKIEFLEEYIINGISDSIFGVNSGNILLGGEEILLKGIRIDLEFGKLNIGEKLKIDDNLMLLTHKNVRVESKEIELKGDKIVFRYGQNEFCLEEGLNYKLGDSSFKVENDGIKIISDGNLGITLGANRGGIKLDGNIDWVNSGKRLLETENNLIKMGNFNWDMAFVGNNLGMRMEEMSRESKEFVEYIRNGINWKFQNNYLGFSDKIEIKSNFSRISLDSNILMENEESSFVVDRESIFTSSSNILMKTSEANLNMTEGFIKFAYKSSIIELCDELTISGERVFINTEKNKFEMGEKIVMTVNENMLEMGNNISMKGTGMDMDFGNYYGRFGAWYGIVKGDYEMVFSGDNYIKSSGNELEIGGMNLLIGGIRIDDNILINTDEFMVDSGKITLSNKMILEDNGIKMVLGDHFFRILSREGIEMGTRYGINMVGNGGINIFSGNKIVIGNEKYNINIERDSLYLNGGLRVYGNQVVMGWANYNMSLNEKVVYLGGESGSLMITDNLGVLEMRDMKIKVKNGIEMMGENLSMSYKSVKMDVENLWIGDKNRILMGERGIEVRTSLMRLDGGMEVGENFLVGKDGNFFKFGMNGLRILSKSVDFSFGVDIKGDVSIVPSRNMRLESTIGDIIINTQGGGILMDGIGKVVRINSEGDFYGRSMGKYLLNCREFRLETKERVGMVGGDLSLYFGSGELKFENDLLMNLGKIELYGIKWENVFKEEILMKSEKCGSIMINGDGIELLSNMNIDILVGNPMGRLRIDSGRNSIMMGDNMELDCRGNLVGVVDGDIGFGAKGKISLIGKSMSYDGGDVEMRMGDFELSGRKMECKMKDMDMESMNMRYRQVGFGEYRLETEGRMVMINRLDGHSSRVVEINVELNSHDESLYIGSRMGGIRMEAKRVRVDGVLSVDRVESERLYVDGDVEVRSLRVGGNIFLGRDGMVSLDREVFEFRNMDLRVDGNVEMGILRCGRIEPGKRLDIRGEIGVYGLETKGMRVGGSFMGDCGERVREFMVINMGDEYVWNTGIRINSGRRLGIEIESDGLALKTGGRVEVGGLMIESVGSERLEEVEDIGSLLEGLDVERTGDGRLRLVGRERVDVYDLLLRLLLYVRKGIK